MKLKKNKTYLMQLIVKSQTVAHYMCTSLEIPEYKGPVAEYKIDSISGSGNYFKSDGHWFAVEDYKIIEELD